MAISKTTATTQIDVLTQTTYVDDTVGSPPTVSVFGVGGFGINMVAKLARPGWTDAIHQVTHIRYFDTSRANIRNGEDVHVIAGGHGSGKVRSANFDEMRQNIVHLSDAELPIANITILVFSLSGGTGSILGPLLLRELARKSSRVIILTVADTQSEIDNANTLATLKSLQNIVEKNEIYLPLMVFDNITQGRSKVDRALQTALIDLIDLLTLPVHEIDRNDRLSWLNAPSTIGASAGLRQLEIYTGTEVGSSLDRKVIFESVLSLGVVRDDETQICELPNRTRFRKDGTFVNHDTPMLGAIRHSTDMIQALKGTIEEAQEVFASQAKNAKSQLIITKDEVDDASGIVL